MPTFSPSLDRALTLATPATWASVASRGKWACPPHLRLLDEVVYEHIHDPGGPQILVVAMPPRHGKSEFVSKRLPAWYVSRYPDRRVILTAYEARFAESFGRAARDIVREHGADWWNVRVRDDVTARNEWQLADHDGGMVSVGMGGALTGRGADLLIVDDPIKNQEEARSPTTRELHWDWWQSTAGTRLEPGGKAIVMATRWHKDDLSGRILAEAANGTIRVRTLILPALAEADDPLGREPGDALWPARFDRAKLESMRASMAPQWWLPLYQQRPTAFEAAEWPAEYFADHIWAREWPHAFELSAMFLDPSKGRTDRSDYSAIVFVGVAQGKLWVRANIRRRPVPEMVRDVVAMFRAHSPHVLGLEANAWQDLLAPPLEEAARAAGVAPLPLDLVVNTVNKQVRVSRLGTYLAQQHVRVWPDESGKLLVDQLRDFPLADHDDGPDALEGAVRSLTNATRKYSQTETEFDSAM